MKTGYMKNEKRGFTLIEIIVVIAIIGLISGVLIPRLPDVTASQLKSTARKLASIITYTYDRAAATQNVYRITFDIEKNSYYLSYLNPERQFEQTEISFVKATRLPKTMSISKMVTATKGTVISGEAYIHFFPSGYVEQSVIYLKDAAQNEMTLIVHPLTGRVVVKEGFVEVSEIDV